jgi:phospho-N-acetylmuramoyl-pentapeptide-transferase
MKRSEGLTPKQKLAGQLIVAGVLCYYFLAVLEDGTTMIIPFTGMTVTLPWYLFIPFCIFALLAIDNGANLTDGLDGLCSSVTVLIATFFTVVALGEGSRIAPITGGVAGSLLGFLLFNVYPAKVFMGDTGSLALGGFVAASAFMLHMPLIVLIVGIIYVAEVLSVVLQVSYFKATHGKRLFKMAPIHHHFELCGWSETRVVAVFSIVTALMCLIAYLGI